jgi:HlyD family secretion protein/epimerase transport system membrane fusion protein
VSALGRALFPRRSTEPEAVSPAAGSAPLSNVFRLPMPRPLGARAPHDGPTDRGPILAGLLIGFVCLGGFGTWSALAPLSSAAVTAGEVKVESHRKSVQHMEGGVIREILVHEGDSVQTGQLLMRIDDAQATSAVAVLRSQNDALRAQEARLIAERDGLPAIGFPDDLRTVCASTEGRPLCAAQEKLFANRRQTLHDQIALLGQRADQLRSEIDGRRAQAAADSRQIAMLAEQIKGVEPLVKQELLPRTRLLALQQQVASLEGERGAQLANIAKAEQQIGETQMQAPTLVNQRQAEVSSDLRDTQEKLGGMAEKLRAATDVQHRTDVIAPQAGKVVDLHYFTPGGVLKPGDTILDIVPQHDDMIIESRIRPIDIEPVHVGLPAEIRLIAYNQHFTPVAHGEVTYVSADALVDARTGQPYYLARTRLDRGELDRLKHVRLEPGMPAQVLIITGKRTLLEYLLSPILDSFSRAFRES